jgi:uncharacterized membrane protein
MFWQHAMQCEAEPTVPGRYVDLDAAVADFQSHGHSTVRAARDYRDRWYVMADPDGNKFCLAQDSTLDG